jgi:hypothetical protein
LPAPKLPPIRTVILGTCAVATAVTSLAPSLAMPSGLIFAADHEAGDVLQEQQRRAALAGELDEMGALQRALEKRMPLLARIATGMPQIRAKPQTGSSRRALELVEFEPSTIRAITSCTS